MGDEGQIQHAQGSKTSWSCTWVTYGSHLLKDLYLQLHPSRLWGAKSKTP